MSIRAHFAKLWNPEDVLDSLWGMVASPYATMLLLLSLAVLVCLAIILPQRPAQVVADPMANGLWLSSVRERFHGTTGWLLGLGLFDISHSLWLRGLLGLLAFNLVLGAVELIRPRPVWHTDGPQDATTLVSALSPSETTEGLVQRVREALRTRHYQLQDASNGRLIYAHRFALFPALVYLGLLLVIAGLALSERTAWWEEEVAMRPGQVRPLGHGTNLALQAEVMPASSDSPSGQPKNERIELTFLQEDRVIGYKTLYNQTPSFYAGLLFYSISTEPALLVQAQDQAGRNLVLQTPETGATQFTELALRFSEEEGPRYIVMLNLTPGNPLGRYFQQSGNEKYVLVPSRDLSLRLAYSPPPPGEVAPTFQVEAFRNAEASPFYQQQLRDTDSLEIAGDRYTFKPHRYAIIKFGQDYGLVLIFVGAAMVLLGMILSAWRPPRRLWWMAQSTEREVNLRFATNAATDSPPRWLESLLQDLAATLNLDMCQVHLDKKPPHPSGDTI